MSSHAERLDDYLGHMLDAADQIQQYLSGKSAHDFFADRMLQDAVIRNIEILGEAARKALEAAPDAATQYPEIPFTAIYAMRNQLSHGYFTVDLDLVWKAVERDMPVLRKALAEALAGPD